MGLLSDLQSLSQQHHYMRAMESLIYKHEIPHNLGVDYNTHFAEKEVEMGL